MGIDIIAGYSGIYSAKVQNPSISYGMNAAENMSRYMTSKGVAPINYIQNPTSGDNAFIEALEKFASGLEQDEFTPSTYEYKYAKTENGEVDKLSILGASYEELGKKDSISTKEANKLFKQFYPKDKKDKSIFNAKVIDTNKNGKVDLEEWGAFLALADVKSKNKDSVNPSLMNGTITDKGLKEALSLLAVNSKNPLTKWRLTRYMRGVFGDFQKSLNLDGAKKQFSNEKENLSYLA